MMCFLLCAEYAFTMKVTEKRDVYSFGVVLLELLTGQSLIQLLEKIRDLVNLVLKLIDHRLAEFCWTHVRHSYGIMAEVTM